MSEWANPVGDMRTYVEAYRDTPPRQAHLVLPAWLQEKLDALPADERALLLWGVDQVAAQHALRTPTKIEAYE